jgi:hypothetical protein
MGVRDLRTDWKRIGRSGKTVDGREIPAVALEQAAKNYDPNLFKALIWPDHIRMFSMGGVEALKAAPNNEGGVDLFAILTPNQVYINIVDAGQRLFTSMELMPNFRGTKEWYLSGLAATDSPASAATTEMRFSSLKNHEALIADFTENTPHQFQQDDEDAPNWFKKLFMDKSTTKPREEDMSPEQTAALAKTIEKFEAVAEKMATALTLSANAGEIIAVEGKAPTNLDELNQKFAAQADEIKALKAQIEKFTAGNTDTKTDDAKTGTDSEKLSQLSTALADLAKQFNAALTAANGTKTGDHTGEGADLSKYL